MSSGYYESKHALVWYCNTRDAQIWRCVRPIGGQRSRKVVGCQPSHKVDDPSDVSWMVSCACDRAQSGCCRTSASTRPQRQASDAKIAMLQCLREDRHIPLKPIIILMQYSYVSWLAPLNFTRIADYRFQSLTRNTRQLEIERVSSSNKTIHCMHTTVQNQPW